MGKPGKDHQPASIRAVGDMPLPPAGVWLRTTIGVVAWLVRDSRQAGIAPERDQKSGLGQRDQRQHGECRRQHDTGRGDH